LAAQQATVGPNQTSSSVVAEGHSFHGQAFDEGPRQAAYLMEGMPQLTFSVTTSDSKAQAFFNQGIGQLHGFWYYEAERSFRQAAALDPNLAMAYWGMAMANFENLKRARGFIQQAVDRKESASRREQLYIDAFENFCREKNSDGQDIPGKQRAQKYTEALELIVIEFPDDIEAKAFLAGQLWLNERNELPILGHVAVNALLQQIFDVNPLHPAHHYRIHLWDRKRAEQALHASAMCGPSGPGIAHLWHMPGHIYSKLHRYQDACWQQEASARVDHAHMIRDKVLPDQIHNFAHNNEWLIRNMINVGRVSDAVSLAKNMIELPRHPKYNSLSHRGSWKYGRERLFQILHSFELWNELIQLSQTAYLQDFPADKSAEELEHHLEWCKYVGIARALQLDQAGSRQISDSLEQSIAELQKSIEALNPAPKEELSPSAPPAETDTNKPAEIAKQSDATAETTVSTENIPTEATQAAKPVVPAIAEGTSPSPGEPKPPAKDDKEIEEKRKKFEQKKTRQEKILNSIQAAQMAAQERWFEAIEHANKGESLELLIPQWQLKSGNYDDAIKAAKKLVADNLNEVLSVALESWIEFQHGGADAADENFELLRTISAEIDLSAPPFKRLEWLAAAKGLESDWRRPYQPATDIGNRPDLNQLGPYRWTPYKLPAFEVEELLQETFSSNNIDKPTLIVCYLGFGCLHCVEQLQAIAPRVSEFREQGIQIMAISTESREQLQRALAAYEQKLELTIYSDLPLNAFRQLRCYDDFEKQPLHGLFLVAPDPINGGSNVLWQDIGHQPFMDVEFLLNESKRILQLSR
jgi:peroxiredoxin